MGYRIQPPKLKHPNRTMQDSSTPAKVFVQNGSTANFAIPCWYMEIPKPVKAHYHSRQHHDHLGWPSPNHPDHICQRWDFAHSCCSFDNNKKTCDRCKMYLNMESLIPIHLIKEGYKTITIAFDDAPEGVTATGYIDTDKDWIVRVLFHVKTNKAIKEHIVVPFTVFAEGIMEGGREATDIVMTGKLDILPGPIA